jgi:hypothetical protein
MNFYLVSRRLHNLDVAAMASSIYIMGILVSEDKTFVCFIGSALEKYPHNL